MYILLAIIGACALGIALHFTLPHRDLRGAAVTPAIATVAAAVLYTVLQWAGIAESDAWLWILSLGGAIVLAAVATWLLSAARRRADAAERRALGI